MKNELKENENLSLFENKRIRRQEYKGEWYYSIVVKYYRKSKNTNDYWYRLKKNGRRIG